VFGVEDFDVYQSRRGLMFLETTEPLGVCVGQDVVRKFNAREQKFLIGRTVLGLLNRAAVLSKLSVNETADLLGNTVRIHVPAFSALGRRSDEQTKALRRAASRRALKALEEPAHSLQDVGPIQMEPLLSALQYSADRAGLLMCGDAQVAMTMVLREDPAFAHSRVEGREQLEQAVRERADLQVLMAFALSEEHFRLRTRLGLSL
jgi:hypothetical protein